MAENVIPLDFAPAPVNQSALEIVEDLLREVKSGNVLAVAIVAVHRGRIVMFDYSKSDHYHEVLSGASRLVQALASDDGDN